VLAHGYWTPAYLCSSCACNQSCVQFSYVIFVHVQLLSLGLQHIQIIFVVKTITKLDSINSNILIEHFIVTMF